MRLSLAIAALALQGAVAGDVRGGASEETLLSAEGDVAAATDGALSEVHAVKAIDPSHSARPDIREFLLACRKKCDDKKNLPASFSGYVSESHCFMGCHWGYDILCQQIGCQSYVKHVTPTPGGTGGATGPAGATGSSTGGGAPGGGAIATGGASATGSATGATGGEVGPKAADKTSFLEYLKSVRGFEES